MDHQWWLEQPCVDGEQEDLIFLGGDSSQNEPEELHVSRNRRQSERNRLQKDASKSASIRGPRDKLLTMLRSRCSMEAYSPKKR